MPTKVNFFEKKFAAVWNHQNKEGGGGMETCFESVN